MRPRRALKCAFDAPLNALITRPHCALKPAFDATQDNPLKARELMLALGVRGRAQFDVLHPRWGQGGGRIALASVGGEG